MTGSTPAHDKASLLAAGTAAGQSDSAPRPCLTWGLLDMPAPWLDQLLGEVEPQACSQLFRCCKALQDPILSRRTLRVGFKLPMDPDTTAAAKAKLMLACQRSSRIKLVFSCSQPPPDLEEAEYASAAVNVNASATSLMFSAAAAMPAVDRGLSAVRSVELVGLKLDALVPSWLTLTCPNMTFLHLNNSHINGLPGPTATIPTCSQLQELHFIPIGHSSGRLEQWESQFRALTGLKGLKTNLQLVACSPVAAQITRLTSELTSIFVALPQLASRFPNLTHLQVPYVTVTDKGMEALLSMQQLQHLQCKGFSLQHSYSQHPWASRLTHLVFSWLDVASLARMPLDGIESFEVVCDEGFLHVYPSDDLNTTCRVAAAIAARGGLAWNPKAQSEPPVLVDNKAAAVDNTCLAATVSIVATRKPIALSLAHVRPVTPALFAAIKHHLPNLTSIGFRSSMFDSGVLSGLLPSLPPTVRRLCLSHCLAFSEAELVEICLGARWPILTTVPFEAWEQGWKQRVQAAMAAAEHQHVTLQGVTVRSEDTSEDEGEDESEDASDDESENE